MKRTELANYSTEKLTGNILNERKTLNEGELPKEWTGAHGTSQKEINKISEIINV